MKIQDLEQLSGMDRATIRYYEKEQLIHPRREENGYRDYSDTDLQELLKIKLLRQLEMPLDKIKALQQGSGELNAALLEQANILRERLNSTETAIQICEALHNTGVRYQELEPAEYLDRLKESDADSPNDTQPVYNDKPAYFFYHPFRRFFARRFDYLLVSVLIDFLLIVVLRIRPINDFLETLVRYGCLFLSVPVTAWMLQRWGTTPGKWLFGFRVMPLEGRNLSYSDFLRREWNVLRYGYGFGIPFWSLWRLWKSYKEYRDYHFVEWDAWEAGFDYQCQYWRTQKKVYTAVASVLILALVITNSVDSVRPKYRGNDITVEQFAENYNFYSQLLNVSVKEMDSDGSWVRKLANNSPNSFVISIGNATPENANTDLLFETEEGSVSRIRYANAWTDISLFRPISNEIQLVCITAYMSQKNMSYSKLDAFSQLISDNLPNQNCHIIYENIEIFWTIAAENCEFTGTYYMTTDENITSRVTLDFELIIH